MTLSLFIFDKGKVEQKKFNYLLTKNILSMNAQRVKIINFSFELFD